MKYAQLKDLATKQEPIPPVALTGVKLTVNVEADYAVVRTQLTRNVVGVVPGTDARLKDTYVTFGAHYDHVGYQQFAARRAAASAASPGCTGPDAANAAARRHHQQRRRR